MSQVIPYSLVSRLLAVLLGGAAVLKVYGLGAPEPVSQAGILSNPEFELVWVEFEVFLASWLFLGAQPVLSWLVCLATFFSFAVVSLYQAWIGQASCGCFGRLPVHPWITFSTDLAIVLSLVVARPDMSALRRNAWVFWKGALGVFSYFSAAVLLLFLILASASFYFGSLSAAIAQIRGHSVSIDPPLVQLGLAGKGELRFATLKVTNLSAHSVRVVGGSRDCLLDATKNLPLMIEAGESCSIPFQLQLPQTPGVFTRKGFLLTDHETNGVLVFRVTGQITN